MRIEFLTLAESCRYAKRHSHQVTCLALKLFDQLASLHHLGESDRRLLEAAGILHDIGWIKGREGHHKTGRDIILNAHLPLTDDAKTILAMTVRYHRKSLPRANHKYFDQLAPALQNKVCGLSALLRLADGLDRGHQNVVEDILCEISDDNVLCLLTTKSDPATEIAYGYKKADLFEQFVQKKVIIRNKIT